MSARTARGLSPRGRGNQPAVPRRQVVVGSIPAWAGKPTGKSAGQVPCRVYPRVGGETGDKLAYWNSLHGLSPRGRGNLRMDRSWQYPDGSIPAWAGKPCRKCRSIPRGVVYPRVGGETRAVLDGLTGVVGLSPRGRGNRPILARLPPAKRSIPAWAGKPGRNLAGRYLRAGGSIPAWAGKPAPTNVKRNR